MSQPRELTGQKFQKLQVLYLAKADRQQERSWVCRCDCGNTTVVSTDHLTRKTAPVQSCGCEKLKKGAKHKDWKGVGSISGNWWKSHVKSSNRLRKNAPAVEITIEQAWELFCVQQGKCAYTQLPLQFGNTSATNSASLDRIDSAQGYTLENVQWVHKDINFMKRTYSDEYFRKLCMLVARGVCGV